MEVLLCVSSVGIWIAYQAYRGPVLWNDIGIFIFRQAVVLYKLYAVTIVINNFSRLGPSPPPPVSFPWKVMMILAIISIFCHSTIDSVLDISCYQQTYTWNNKHHLEISNCISHYFHKLFPLITVNYWLIFHACIAIAAYSKCVLSHLITLSFAKAMVHSPWN